ncbi:prepilin-type N-terminal cleavage/methylation domain-containing protein [Idiomarina ramblicola]|uniref:Type II secretory pathway component n=1 Tax=Idiomarina ramblicola TaxID=263724 RepID=A0A432Z226_9GAMM|nr:prepilin-type N-terminal cleavage/methylation domain-containing protein [Idiomarina ramblicola]RUO71948.1 Type II secretory pathway component [Idiomarina ramblicola]
MKSIGFTLIELIIILVIIGILAVSVSPVFFDNSGTQSQVLRQRAMSILRSIQLQAMQDTNNCYIAVVEQNALGEPTSKSTDCSTGSLPAAGESPFTEENNRQIRDSGNVTFSLVGVSSLPGVIGFDVLGRPTGQCSGGCTITLAENSGVSRNLCVNGEGYINEC